MEKAGEVDARGRRSPWWDAPRIVALLVAIGGVGDVLQALRPRTLELRALEWAPEPVVEISRASTLLLGLFLIGLAGGLARRRRNAWILAVAATFASSALHVARRPDVGDAIFAVAVLAVLILTRRAFVAGSDRATLGRALVAIPVLAAAVVAYGVFGFMTFGDEVRPSPTLPGAVAATARQALLLPQPYAPLNAEARWFLISVSVAGVAAVIYVLYALLRPAIERRLRRREPEAKEIAARHGRAANVPFALLPDKSHLLLAGEEALVAYRSAHGVAVALGDPICPEEKMPEVLDEFLELCRSRGWHPCFYQSTGRFLDLYASRGLSYVKMGEEAILDVPGFKLSGKKMANVRHSVTKVEERDGVAVSEIRREDLTPQTARELQDVSAAWLAGKKGGALGFTLGDFDPDAWEDERVFGARSAGGGLVGFTSWLPFDRDDGGRPRGYTLDAMRQTADAPGGLMDALIARSVLAFKDEGGVLHASLGNAPLANVDADDPSRLSRMDRAVRMLYENFNQVYGYKSLFAYKKKFRPAWEGAYLVYEGPGALPATVRAVVSVLNPEGLGAYLRRPRNEPGDGG